MRLVERLAADITSSLKDGKKERLETLRFVSAQLKNREIEKHGTGQGSSLTDEEVLSVFDKEAKKRREAIELYRKGNREDLAKSEASELKIIEEYLPPPFSEAELSAIIEEEISRGVSDFGALI